MKKPGVSLKGIPALLLNLLLAPGSGLAQNLELSPSGAIQTEVITVEGQRIKDEQERSARAGQSINVQPQESSRFDTATQLRRESSLTLPETGRITPSGFVIPRIRGQDSKLTDIYLEDTLLQDPYSGLPLVEDLDLRAFGMFELHQGVSPVSVPNINPIGTMRFRFNPVKFSRASIGLSTGSPYGLGIWSLGIHKTVDQEIRIYVRTHQTSGRYPYYSDNGTPYNEADDKRRIRSNNDQRSHQFIPTYRKTFGPYSLQAVAWFHEAERGIASSSMVLDTSAREANKGYLADVNLSREWKDLSVFDRIIFGVHLAKTDDKRETSDPEKRVLNSSRQATMQVSSDREGFRLKTENSWLQTNWSYELSQSDIDQSFESIQGTSLKRENAVGLFGLAFNPFDRWLLEYKHSEQHQNDESDLNRHIYLEGEIDNPEAHKTSAANTISLAYGDFEDGIYAQWAKTQRLPALFEEFGNGSTVRPNASLRPENILHHEIGVFKTLFGLEFAFAHYRDATDDKIVFIPILANATKALNVSETKIRGNDASLSWRGESTNLSFKMSDIEAYDTSRTEKKYLPAIPRQVYVTEWRQEWNSAWVSYLCSRYRSKVYRDLANAIELPGAIIYDMNVDYKYRHFEIGLALRNLANTTDVEISAGNNKGRTAFSDFAGAPLPGRQWILSLVYNTEPSK